MSTYNGYGARLVADHGLRIGIEPATRLATEGLRWQLALAVVRLGRGSTSTYPRCRWPSGYAGSPTRCPPIWPTARPCATRRPLGGEWSPRTRRCRRPQGARASRKTRLQLLGLVEAFEQAKRDALLLDYGDQIALAARLAEPTWSDEAERSAYRVVLLDEYQDTGVAQRAMLQRLFGPGHPVTAVGDPAQSIYGFRGASVGNILNFPAPLPARRRSGPARRSPARPSTSAAAAPSSMSCNCVVRGRGFARGSGHGTVTPPLVL